MNEQATKWFDGLLTFSAECRKRLPLMARADLSTAEEMQCRIIGGSLLAWLQKYGPRLLQERAVFAGLENWEKDPFIVFTSDRAGLVAASEILEESPPRIAFLHPDEFASWTNTHPDAEYRWHVHMWSFFEPLDADTAKRAEKFPLQLGETYWLHREGTMCGQLFGRGGDSLWKWNGTEPTLLEEGFSLWVS